MYESKPLGNLCRQVCSDTIQPKWKARGAPCCINLLRPLKHGWKVSKCEGMFFQEKPVIPKNKSAVVSPNASFRDVDFGEWRMLLTWHCEKGTVVSSLTHAPRYTRSMRRARRLQSLIWSTMRRTEVKKGTRPGKIVVGRLLSYWKWNFAKSYVKLHGGI